MFKWLIGCGKEADFDILKPNKMFKDSYLVAILMTIVLSGCSTTNKDQDGNSIQSVSVGDQVWMAKNLNVGTFRNGDPIPEVKSEAEWIKAGESAQPAWCYFKNDPANGPKYGRLYNWYAVADERGLAPEGWHVPGDEEWTAMTNAIGGQTEAGVRLKSATGWSNNGNGRDDYGFNILASGGRGGVSGFNGEGTVAVFWSSTSKSPSFAWYRVVHAHRTGVFQENDDKMSGFSVRCVKDSH